MKHINYIDRKTGNTLQENVPGEKWLKWLYHNPLGKLALHALVKRKFLSTLYGNTMDKSSSKSKISDFVSNLNINMNEAILNIEDFKTFNDFFIRKLKPEARPINLSSNVLVSPADGKVMAFKNLNKLDSFFIKGQKFSVDKFLNNDSINSKYKNGSLLIFRLAPVDYHRFHFPADGIISKSTKINGNYFSVSPYAIKNNLSIYWENKREYSILKTNIMGDILISEVGATMVGSIIQSYSENKTVKKGEEKGWFKFGGSTVVLLLEKDKLNIDSDILQNTSNGFETSIKMGEQIAN